VRNSYTSEQLEFLKEGYKQMAIRDLTPAFNARFGLTRTPGQIKAALGRHKFVCGRGYGEHLMPEYIAYTVEQAQFLREGYTTMTLTQLVAAYNERFGAALTEDKAKSFMGNHKVHSGRTGRFEKGITPWNTGTKGVCKGSCTSFKKGNIPPNRKPVGSERIGKDGYIEIKVQERDPYTGFPTRYKFKHIVVYEQEHGPVPKGMVVIFKDGDNRNFYPGNLMLLSRTELLRLNGAGYKAAPDEVKPSLVALAKLEAKARIRTYPLNCGRRKKRGQ
jgi:hypothetical protein